MVLYFSTSEGNTVLFTPLHLPDLKCTYKIHEQFIKYAEEMHF